MSWLTRIRDVFPKKDRIIPIAEFPGIEVVAQQTAQFQPLVIIVLIIAAAAHFWKHGKMNVLIAAQTDVVQEHERRDNRNFLSSKLKEEIMLILQSCL